MLLNEYQWSRNPRGMHNKNAAVRMELDKLIYMKMGWAKMVSLGSDYFDLIEQLIRNNITPIVRVWHPHFGASAPTPEMLKAWQAYYSRGVKWFEFYNEPNLDNEWPQGTRQTYKDINGIIAPLMQNWLAWAEWVIEMGGYPAFPALAETVDGDLHVIRWLNVMMTYLAENFYDRFRAVAANGLWCATHPYIYNHFYQEAGSPTQMRQPEEQRLSEGGWHFEYPYDPVMQANNPGITSFSGPPDKPEGDPIGLVGVGMAFMTKFQELFGGGAIPVIGTEGGIYPVPKAPGDSVQIDGRFPSVSWNSHAEATVAMFNWLASSAAPPWMFGITLWKEDDYFESPAGDIATVRRLAEHAPVYKEVPPLEPLGGYGPDWLGVRKGPEPIHGSPDYHFLIIAPGFNAEWFFNLGQAYWTRFRPTILTGPDYIAYLKKSLGVTVLATPDVADYIQEGIRKRWPNVWVDMIVTTNADELARVLHDRATSGRRFG